MVLCTLLCVCKEVFFYSLSIQIRVKQFIIKMCLLWSLGYCIGPVLKVAGFILLFCLITLVSPEGAENTLVNFMMFHYFRTWLSHSLWLDLMTYSGGAMYLICANCADACLVRIYFLLILMVWKQPHSPFNIRSSSRGCVLMGKQRGLCQLAVVLEAMGQVAGCWRVSQNSRLTGMELRMQVWIVPQVFQFRITGQRSGAFAVIPGANLCDLSHDSVIDVFRTSEEWAAIFFQSGFWIH